MRNKKNVGRLGEISTLKDVGAVAEGQVEDLLIDVITS